MILFRILAAAIFFLAPHASFAICYSFGETVSICDVGLVWDEEQQACVDLQPS